jgi:hypothetical protein
MVVGSLMIRYSYKTFIKALLLVGSSAHFDLFLGVAGR